MLTKHLRHSRSKALLTHSSITPSCGGAEHRKKYHKSFFQKSVGIPCTTLCKKRKKVHESLVQRRQPFFFASSISARQGATLAHSWLKKLLSTSATTSVIKKATIKIKVAATQYTAYNICSIIKKRCSGNWIRR